MHFVNLFQLHYFKESIDASRMHKLYTLQGFHIALHDLNICFSLPVSTEQTSSVFEQLCRLVKPVINPGDCSSAERCILAHLYEVYTVCAHLRSKTHQAEPFSNAYPKIRLDSFWNNHSWHFWFCCWVRLYLIRAAFYVWVRIYDGLRGWVGLRSLATNPEDAGSNPCFRI